MLAIIAGVLACASCNDDDNSGQPEILQVRLTNPEKADSTFTNAFPGQMITITGKNLDGIQKIFINNQEVGFNPNFGTSTDIIVTIPANIQLKGSNPDLPDEIRIETSHGIATYAFHIYSPAPVINRISLKYPATAGAKMLVYGANFYEIQKIVFEGASGMNVDATGYTVNKDFNVIEITIPAGVEDGLITVYCYTDKASIEFTTTVAPPSIRSFSSDMPVIGDRAFITGAYFIDVANLNINGEFDIPGADLQVSESYDTVYFRLPQAPTKGGVVTVTAAGGSTSSSGLFYPIENVMLNYDGIGWYSWGDAVPVTANGSQPPYVSSGVCYHVYSKPGAWNYWFGNTVNNGVYPSTSTIPGNTPVGNLRLRFECYMNQILRPASFEIALKGNWNQIVTDYVPVDINTGSARTGKWITCELPLSAFTTATDYGGFASNTNNELGVYAKNKSDNKDVVVDIYFDNFRIVDITK